jgi:DNA-binding MarR family transcriptional regulator
VTKRRKALLAELQIAGREMSAVTIMFHTAVSAKVGLSVTEEKTLDILARSGALTARDLSQRTGLTPASVTALLNRLEKKRFVRRVGNPSDGRSILIELQPDSLRRLGSLFEDFSRSLDELYASYSDDDLELILEFMTKIARRQRESATKLIG